MPIAPALADQVSNLERVPELSTGAKAFDLHCAGCHINGGNIVRRGKNLKLKTLQKNHMDSIEAIATIVTNGKGNMSAYRDRLPPEQIQAVAGYVLDRAQADWR
ncbi:MAG: c-type cytochrome [Oscillatoriophycideae cyanobacterium NC_groundwater_1537_Pr4_S-0.65um_50_18]|nr:c-type cytochrome [Oscillatoriophycideae cyanobacterium NC_groundwater_1537_Pr4_S-0.65um_50_18]